MQRRLLLLGPVWLVVTYGLAAAGVEPVATHFYLYAWSGLIFSFDRLIAVREGTSLIARVGAAGFVRLLFWSAVAWFFYELCNLRLQNWYYILVEDDELLRLAGTFVAFGTVFPGIFWIDHWLRVAGMDGVFPIPPLRWTPARRRATVAAGAGFFALWLADPVHFYPLVWGGTFLLLAPLNERLGIDGLLRQLQRGDFMPTLRLLLAGFIAGGCWELFNFWARAKWVYTVPFFDQLKLFEMPLLGFVGFPPFAVECACTYRLLVWLRLAPPFGDFRQQGPVRCRTFVVLATILALLGSLGVYEAMQRTTVTSTTPRILDVEALSATTRQRLAGVGIEHLTDLVGVGSQRRWRRVEAVLDPATVDKLRDIVDLYLHEGIGTAFGNRLVAAGVVSLADLGTDSVEGLLARLAAVPGDGRMPTRAQVKVWRRRLPAAD